MKRKLIEFQEDLRNGLTLEEACTKHQITLKEAFEDMPKTTMSGKHLTRDVNRTPARYITKRLPDRYTIRKMVNGDYLTFGTYTTLEDAVRMRDHCEKHGWIQSNVDDYCKMLGIHRCETIMGRRGRYRH